MRKSLISVFLISLLTLTHAGAAPALRPLTLKEAIQTCWDRAIVCRAAARTSLEQCLKSTADAAAMPYLSFDDIFYATGDDAGWYSLQLLMCEISSGWLQRADLCNARYETCAIEAGKRFSVIIDPYKLPPELNPSGGH